MEKKDIKIKYTSHLETIIPWLDEAIRKAAKKNDYEFIGSGLSLISAERDMQLRKKNKD